MIRKRLRSWGLILSAVVATLSIPAVVASVSLIEPGIAPLPEPQIIVIEPEPLPETQAQISPTVWHYLAEWEWLTDSEAWQCPYGTCLDTKDMRGLTDAGTPGPLSAGYGWFIYATEMPGISINANREFWGINLCDTNECEVPPGRIRQVENFFGITISATKSLDILKELLTIHGDPTGIDRWRNYSGEGFWLGGEQYQFNKANVVSFDSEQAQITPSYASYVIPSPSWQPTPAAHISFDETWDCPDSSDPDCDLNWTELVTNLQILTNGLQMTQDDPSGWMPAARCESCDVGTEYMKVSADITWSIASSLEGYVSARMTSGTADAYLLGGRGSSDRIYISKIIGGIYTYLNYTGCTINAGDTFTVTGTVGVAMSLNDLAVEMTGPRTCSLTHSDSSITSASATYSGVKSWNSNGTHRFDNFHAESLHTATPSSGDNPIVIFLGFDS